MNKQCNYYCTGKNGEELRAVAINGHWRICKRKTNWSEDWLFIDDIEYDTHNEALQIYI